MAFVVIASVVVTVLVLSATIAEPGYALDPQTGVPVGAAIPGHVRVTVLRLSVHAEAQALARTSASVPATLLIALGGFIRITSGLNRFGVHLVVLTWRAARGPSHLDRIHRQHGSVQRTHPYRTDHIGRREVTTG
jgi:hypothetical protein